MISFDGNLPVGASRQSCGVGGVQFLSQSLGKLGQSLGCGIGSGLGSIEAGHALHDPDSQRQHRPWESMKSNDSLCDEMNTKNEPKRRAATVRIFFKINFH